MFRTLVKTDTLAIDDQTVPVRYFELRTLRGTRRYSAEILLGPGDRIILDDDSVTNLEARTTRLVPATLYSRMLAPSHGGLARRIPREEAQQQDVRRRALSTWHPTRGSSGDGRERAYFLGRTASFSCLAMRALTTVLAGILIASPVAGLRPIRALRF